MKIKAYQTTQFGDFQSSQLCDIEAPTINDYQVLVEVHYASINPIDWKTRKGLGWGAEAIKNQLPWVLGNDFSGKIIKVGKHITDYFTVGQLVCGNQDMINNGGSFAQQIKVDPKDLVVLPTGLELRGLDLRQAAAIPLVGLTAWQAITKLKILGGEKVLICGGTGGVGHLAIGLCNALGAQVYATASTKKQAILSELKAIPIDYQQTNYHQSNSDLQQQFDVILDCVGGDAGIQALDFLKPQGRMLTLPTITFGSIKKVADEQGKSVDITLKYMDNLHLEGLLNRLNTGKLKILIDSEFPFDQIEQAQTRSESGRATGKVLVKMPK